MNNNFMTSEQYRYIVEQTLKNTAKTLSFLKEFVPDIIIYDQELQFICPQKIGRLGIIFQFKRGVIPIKKKKKFNVPSLRQVHLRPIYSFRNIGSDSIKTFDKGFELVYDKLDENLPYILEVEFDIEDPRFLDRLVHRKVQDDVLESGDKRRYWMHAQLRFVKGLEKLFSNVIIQDLNFDVNIAIHEDIRVSIPTIFKKELEIVVKWLKETHRERKFQLSHAHLRLLRERGKIKSDILELLRRLQQLFMPTNFTDFIKIGRDFRYLDCKRGTDYYSAPFPTWPKFMIVTTRTDLSMDKPAAKGYLDFYYKQFRLEIEHLFNEYYNV